MANAGPRSRRERVERNVYRRTDAKGREVLEVGFKDGSGVQRWRTVEGGLKAARALRDEMLSRRHRGERVAPNVRLRFGEAAHKWLAGPVLDLRPSTRAGYRNAVETHLRPRFAKRRLDRVEPDDLAALVRDLRSAGKSEATIVVVLGVTNRIYRYAARRLSWAGTNPVGALLSSERPKPSHAQRKRLFDGEALTQTIAAAHKPYKALFTLGALTGARISELLALTWADVHIEDPDDAEVEFGWQLDRRGERRPSKTDGSSRTVPIPRQLAAILAEHRLASRETRPTAYVFATRTGRPLAQRNVTRELRKTQARACDEDGRPTFPILHERDEHDKPVPVPRGAVPSMHSLRHTVASRALLAGESADEVAFLLGHRDGNVTRAVYMREIADARRRAMRRERMAAEYGAALGAASAAEPSAPPRTADVVPLKRRSAP
jgi:integrase